MTQIQEGFPLQQSSKCEYRYQQKEKWALTPSMRTFIIETQWGNLPPIVGRVLYKFHYLNVRDKTVWASFAKERFISTEQTPISGLDQNPETTCDCSE